MLRELFAAWNVADLDRLFELVDPDVEVLPIRWQLEGTSYRRPEGIRQMAQDTAAEYEFIRVMPDEFRLAGEEVLMLGHFDARGRASGIDLRFPVAWIARFRLGKLTYLRAYLNIDEAVEAAGLLE